MTQPTQPDTDNLPTKELATNFSLWFTDAVIDFQKRTRTWLTSALAVSDLIGVSASTVLAWKNAASIPRREQCAKIAEAFGIDIAEVLAAAGHPMAREDRAVTYTELSSAIEQSTVWPAEQRAQIIDALRDASSPQFAESPWRRATDALLRSAQPYTERAERIAQIVGIWQQETRQKRHHTA